MKYVLMFCGRTPQDAAALEAMSEEARAQRDARVSQWFAEYRSKRRTRRPACISPLTVSR